MPSPTLNAEQANRHAEVMQGNKFAIGLKTEQSKTQAFKSYCDHLGGGWSPRSWHWKDDEGNHCASETMQKMIKENVFSQAEWKAALAAQYSWWERKGRSLIDGDIKGNPITFMAFMRNMFDWDKRDDTVTKLQDVIIALKSPDQKTADE